MEVSVTITRQFDYFVQNLNHLAVNFVIKFGSWKGRQLFEIKLYLDPDSKIQYKLFTKPTDARNYGPIVSIQIMLLIWLLSHKCSVWPAETRQSHIQQLKSDLPRSGHDPVKLDASEHRVTEQLQDFPSQPEEAICRTPIENKFERVQKCFASGVEHVQSRKGVCYVLMTRN